MPETPAAHLARLKVTYPNYHFWKGNSTDEFRAIPPSGEENLYHARTLGALEAQLAEAERKLDIH